MHKRASLMSIMIVLLVNNFSNAQHDTELSPQIRNTVSKIAQDNMYKSSAIGYGGARPEQWDRFEKLKQNATDQELITLTDHKNPAVRSYAFQALAERNSNSIFEILLNHLTDTAQLQTFQGCIVSSQTVGDFFLDVVTPPYISPTAYKLNRKQRKTVDSLLLYDDNARIENRAKLLENLEIDDSNYERIRKIYMEEKDPSALVALSKFNLEQDKQFIIDWLIKTKTREQYQGLKAARNFIDDDIYAYLIKIHAQEIKKPGGFNYPLIRMLYFVLVQYQTEETRELIEMSLKTKGATYTYHSRYIWLALEKYPNPIFEGLQKKIKMSDYALNSVKYWLEGVDG